MVFFIISCPGNFVLFHWEKQEEDIIISKVMGEPPANGQLFKYLNIIADPNLSPLHTLLEKLITLFFPPPHLSWPNEFCLHFLLWEIKRESKVICWHLKRGGEKSRAAIWLNRPPAEEERLSQLEFGIRDTCDSCRKETLKSFSRVFVLFCVCNIFEDKLQAALKG